MEELAAYRESLLSALTGVVDQLSEIVAAIPYSAWQFPFGHKVRTPHYLMAHLRELEIQGFSVQLRRFLEEDTPRVPLFNEAAWMASHYKPEEPVQAILADFANLRLQELNWLRGLPPASWSRTARHPFWGVRTLQWFVELQLEYSYQHLGELTAFHAM
jgi:hypothetical protein